MRSVIESNTNPTYDKAQALRLYVEQSEMDALVQEDMERYRDALEATGGTVDDIEPISRFHEVFQGPVDAAYAAAVVGLETETLLENIRENVGLQNIGLLALDSENGSMKRDTWTSSFRDIILALDFPERFTPPTVITPPKPIPGAVVHIPDPNLRAAIAEALGKNPNAPITVEEMETLAKLETRNGGINDLTGLQFAANLRWLHLWYFHEFNDLSPIAGLINIESIIFGSPNVSDLSPLAGLINLKKLHMDDSKVSDLSPLAGLIKLEWIHFDPSNISDLSPIAGLTQLKHIDFTFTDPPVTHDTKQLSRLVNLTFLGLHSVDDLTPLARLTKLEKLFFGGTDNIRDLKPLVGLTNLRQIHICCMGISDLSPLRNLTKLQHLYLPFANISDLTPLAGLTGLEDLYLHGNSISDISILSRLTGLKRISLANNSITNISPLARLTQLKWADLADNEISDASPLARLNNLKWLAVDRNNISDLSSLEGLRENIELSWSGNPGIPKGGPKIEGPWLWVVLPDTELDSDTDLLSEASGGTVTELAVATHGAAEGQSVGGEVWTSRTLPPTGNDNIEDMLQRSIPYAVIYGTVSLHSPRQQETTMHVGSDHGLKVWLNGTLVYERFRDIGTGDDYQDFFPVILKQGRNVLLVAIRILPKDKSAFFGFKPGTEYSIANPGVGYAFSKTPIHLDDTFTLDISAEAVFDLAGWQFDIVFDPAALEAINVSEGDF